MIKELFNTALAQSPPITSIADVQSTMTKIVNWMISGFWIAAVGTIIWAAFIFLTAGDDKEKVEKAKKMLLYAVIAAAIALLANGISAITFNILKGK